MTHCLQTIKDLSNAHNRHILTYHPACEFLAQCLTPSSKVGHGSYLISLEVRPCASMAQTEPAFLWKPRSGQDICDCKHTRSSRTCPHCVSIRQLTPPSTMIVTSQRSRNRTHYGRNVTVLPSPWTVPITTVSRNRDCVIDVILPPTRLVNPRRVLPVVMENAYERSRHS